jgi:UDP-N-acetylglucosamine transferase subunit ALG13
VIFVTVGGQLPFDRLVHAVDQWAEEDPGGVFAQIGASDRPPARVRWQRFLSPGEFQSRVAEARLVVSHAGIGTILTAIDLRKPIVVMPRRQALGEHRNDHQWATVQHLRADLGVHVAEDEHRLVDYLARATDLSAPSAVPSPERQRLLSFLEGFIESA